MCLYNAFAFSTYDANLGLRFNNRPNDNSDDNKQYMNSLPGLCS